LKPGVEEDEMVKRVMRTLLHSLLPPTPAPAPTPIPLILSVSGGTDSMALLHAVHSQTNGSVKATTKIFLNPNDPTEAKTRDTHPPPLPNNSYKLHVATFDHLTRGGKSTSDSAFVKDFVATLNSSHKHDDIELHEFMWGNEEGSFSQEAARKWRRQVMSKLKASLSTSGEGYIFTGHHKDDDTETILMKLIRGVHISKLKGMDAKDEDGGFVKPFLKFPKAVLVAYNKFNGVEWIEDGSNVEKGEGAYLRNRVRNELIPLLGELCSDSGDVGVVGNRLENLVEQVRDINNIMVEKEKGGEGEREGEGEGEDGEFLLKGFDSGNYLHRGRLYGWIIGRLGEGGGGNGGVSYRQLGKICELIDRRKGDKERGVDIGKGRVIKMAKDRSCLKIVV